MSNNRAPECPNPNCDNGLIKGTLVGCCICNRAAAVQAAKMLHVQQKELTQQYRWKAENNIRFFDKLGMTTEEKVQFLAEEFARVHISGRLEPKL